MCQVIDLFYACKYVHTVYVVTYMTVLSYVTFVQQGVRRCWSDGVCMDSFDIWILATYVHSQLLKILYSLYGDIFYIASLAKNHKSSL